MMFIIGILILTALIIGLYKLFKRDKTFTDTENPQDILEKRYARGDINEKEYERRKRKLQM